MAKKVTQLENEPSKKWLEGLINKDNFLSIAAAVLLRIFLSNSNFATWFQTRPELVTPISSPKNINECIHYLNTGNNIYLNDQCHEVSYIVKFYAILQSIGTTTLVNLVLDVLTGILIKHYAIETQNWYVIRTPHKEAQVELKSGDWFMNFYLFNPLTLAIYLSGTTQILYNFLIMVFLSGFNAVQFIAGLALGLVTVSQVYTSVLIVPFFWFGIKHPFQLTFGMTVMLLLIIGVFQSCDYLNAVYGFIFKCQDYTPNTGIFWYLITEMFEHFRQFFIAVLQLHVFIYPMPVCTRLKKADLPIILFTLLTIQATFKPYTTLSDLLLPITLSLMFHQSDRYRKTSTIAYRKLG